MPTNMKFAVRQDWVNGTRFKLRDEARSLTHEDGIEALVGVECIGDSEDSDSSEIVSTLRYCRTLGQMYGQ